MYENTYPIDTAASILGCTQKKILTEWAKGTIKIALDFGPESSINRQSYTDYDKWGYPAKPWNIASISAPATNDYFPPCLVSTYDAADETPCVNLVYRRLLTNITTI
ncbi:hypothetical protein ACI1VO_29290, partial [Escherichia coli]